MLLEEYHLIVPGKGSSEGGPEAAPIPSYGGGGGMLLPEISA